MYDDQPKFDDKYQKVDNPLCNFENDYLASSSNQRHTSSRLHDGKEGKKMILIIRSLFISLDSFISTPSRWTTEGTIISCSPPRGNCNRESFLAHPMVRAKLSLSYGTTIRKHFDLSDTAKPRKRLSPQSKMFTRRANS